MEHRVQDHNCANTFNNLAYRQKHRTKQVYGKVEVPFYPEQLDSKLIKVFFLILDLPSMSKSDLSTNQHLFLRNYHA